MCLSVKREKLSLEFKVLWIEERSGQFSIKFLKMLEPGPLVSFPVNII